VCTNIKRDAFLLKYFLAKYNLVVILPWDIFYLGYNSWKLNRRRKQAGKIKRRASSWVAGNIKVTL
jgi:hypothetical protein